MMQNAYPELPNLAFQRTSVAMDAVIAYMQQGAAPAAVKRAAYVMFRNESGNGSKGINNNYIGAQADSGRWPPQFDPDFSGTVTIAENGTHITRIFMAFRSWEGSVDFLINRVTSRGLYIGGQTHKVLQMAIGSEQDLVRAYHKEWVTGSANSEPSDGETASFLSMYHQAITHFA